MNIVTLQNAHAKLEIAPELGGSIINFNVTVNNNTYPIIRQVTDPQNVLDCGSFPLVPFSNRIKHGQFSWNGNTITLPANMPPTPHAIHGSGWQHPWQIVEHSDTKLVIEYQNQCPEWPFDFIATQTFELAGQRLTVSTTLQNLSNESMPAGLGAHPYFTRTKSANVTADLPQMWAVDNECLPTDIVSSVFAASEHNNIVINEHVLDNAFMHFQQPAVINWPEWQLQAELSASDNCPFMIIYSPENEDFFCLEPVTHCTDAFNKYQAGETDTGIQILEPKATLKTTMAISVHQTRS